MNSTPSPARRATRRGTGPGTEYAVIKEGLDLCRALVKDGVPIVVGSLDENGNPSGPEWEDWQSAEPDFSVAGDWDRGLAIAAVTGAREDGRGMDAIDWDRRNDPEGASLRALIAELGEDGPELLGRHWTASGGSHRLIVPVGMPKGKIAKWIDYLGGTEDGDGRALMFVPPTVRRSKLTGRPTRYRVAEPYHRNGQGSCARLAEIVGSGLSHGARTTALGPPRQAATDSYRATDGGRLAELERAVRGAKPGDRHDALRDWALRFQFETEDDDYIVWRGARLLGELGWKLRRSPEADIRALLKKGSERPIANSGGQEAAELAGIVPASAGLVEPFSAVTRERVSWLWPGYLAFRKLTQLDGEKGQGKTVVSADVTARASRGRPMPGQAEAVCEPISVIIFTDEGAASDDILPKLEAAGADMGRVFRPKIVTVKNKRGGARAPAELLLPDGAALFGKMIREAGAQLAIFDPITDFLQESVSTNNDASVRRALKPLGAELERQNCAGLAIRHMNKDTSKAAKHRGGGTIAFQNRARVHLVTGKMPAGYEGDYGLAIVGSNFVRFSDEVLSYSIVDSDVELDDIGNYVGRVLWHGAAPVTADVLTRGEEPRHGPAAVVQDPLVELLRDMFSDRSEWPSKEALAKVQAITKDKDTIGKAKRRAGIRSERLPGDPPRWVWTNRPLKARVSKTTRDKGR